MLGWALESAARLGAHSPDDLRPDGGSGKLETLLMQRALALRPVPYCGEILMALASPSWRQRLRFIMDALLPAGDYGDEGRGRVIALPRRSLDLMHQATWRASMRRSVR